MSVFFHGSFGLNRKYMSSVLNSIITNPRISTEKLAEPFGYKAPFGIRYKAWLNKVGILNGAQVTEFGQIINERDPELDSLVTQWYMHHELTKSPLNAETWHFFIKEYLPKTDVFARHELEVALSRKLMGHSTEHFAQGRPMNKKITKKLLDCYLKPEALGSLGFLEEMGRNKFTVKVPSVVLGPWESSVEFSRAF